MAEQGAGLLEAIRKDAQRSLFRARNGIKYVTGLSRPEVGQTPRRAVWSRDKATLWRYGAPHPGQRPIVITFSIMGKPYVLDLQPGNSFVGHLLAADLDVFLLDFGVPDVTDAGNTLETYVEEYIPQALQAARRTAGTDAVDVLGYCLGGMLAALAVAADPGLARTLAVMAAPFDFRDMTGVIQAFVRGQLEVDEIVDHTGNIPAEAVHRMFRSLNPTAAISNYATLWERMWNDDFVEIFQIMSRWSRDQVPFPGATARQGVDLLLRRNVLLTGRVPLGGGDILLADITCPVLNIVASHDHIVTPEAARPLNALVGTDDVTEVVVPSGHIGLATGRQAVTTTVPEILRWLNQR